MNGGRLLERNVLLPPELSSAGSARRLLRALLVQADRSEWLEAAELACTEVVTNAVLHAHTNLIVAITLRNDAVRVEVRDFSPLLPAVRGYDTQATTGRGMALVAVVTADHGISDIGPDGKTVWFEVGGHIEEAAEEHLLATWGEDGWDLDDHPTSPPVGPEAAHGRHVVLRAMPATLWLAAQEHHDAILRELVLYCAAHDGLDVDVAAADRARSTIASAVGATIRQAETQGTARPAVPEGHPSPLPWVPPPFDLTMLVGAELGAACSALQDTLDTAERLAVQGRLLVRPGLPEIIAVRDWACEQIVAQLAGSPSTPWPGTAQERFVTAVHRRDDPAQDDHELAVLRDSARGVVAADDANRIVAVSRVLAELLGWRSEDLVGRRVVTLIPHRLREAHVAGFSRHLSTGEAHVLGVPLTLPLLTAQGEEVNGQFLIEHRRTDAGRVLYLAWIEVSAG